MFSKAIVRKPTCEANMFCASKTAESRENIWYQCTAFKPPSGLGSVVVDSLLCVTLIVGFCYCSMFCYALHYVHSSFAIILMG